jgi:hypothetical protein
MAVTMTPEIADACIDEFISMIAERIDSAAAISKAAVTCMEAGNREQAVTIAMDIEQLLSDANQFLGCATLIKRSAGS